MTTRKDAPITDLKGWYTAGEAAKKLTTTSGRPVSPAYVRTLARLGKIGTKKIGERTTLYKKADVDAYKVEAPAEKANRVRAAKIVGTPDTAAARKAGSRRKSQDVSKQVG